MKSKAPWISPRGFLCYLYVTLANSSVSNINLLFFDELNFLKLQFSTVIFIVWVIEMVTKNLNKALKISSIINPPF